MTSGHWTLQIFAGAGHVTSQISTPLPASKSPGVTGSADKKWWVYRYQFWSDYRWWALVMSFTGSSLYRLPVGAVPVKKTLSVGCQWSVLLDPGTSTRGLSTGGTVGGTGSSHVPVKLSTTPFQWLPVITLFWYWNLHQRPFHWCDCWGYRFRSVQTTGGCCSCEETPSVAASDQSCLILEPPPEAFPLVWLLGVPVPVCTDYRWVLFLWRNPFSGCQWSVLLDPGTSTRGLSTGGTVGGYWFQSCSCEAVKDPPPPPQWFPVISPVDTGTSTRGLSTGVTGGVPVPVLFRPPVRLLRGFTYQKSQWPLTLISPVQNFGPVPGLFRLPVGSLASQWWGIPAPVLLRLPVVVTEIQQGLPVK